jgi:hypothetical protein
MIVNLAPFVPSRPEVVQKMLEISEVNSEDVVFDLGCGDGRIILSAVRDFDARKAVGYEVRNDLCREVAKEIANQNLHNRVILISDDLMDANISEATVITLYLTTSGNERLKPKLSSEAKTGARIISHDFEIKGWRPLIKETFQGHTIYLYLVPNAFQSV